MADRPSAALGMAALLHRGAAAGSWGSLGLWAGAPGGPAEATPDYASACRALALAVGQAAGLRPGQRVLSLACGAGDELLLWAQHFGATQVVGLEIDPERAEQARRITRTGAPGTAEIEVVCGSAMALDSCGTEAQQQLLAGPFDAVLCVDAAYHLSPRVQVLQQALARLAPGGRLAYTDLVLHPAAAATTPPGTPRDGTSPNRPTWAQQALLRSAARLCGVPSADLLPLPAQLQRLQQLGAVDVQGRLLDEAVLDGFAQFAQRQARAHHLRPWQPGWRAVATTAALIGPCRKAGLGYALLTATRPAASALPVPRQA